MSRSHVTRVAVKYFRPVLREDIDDTATVPVRAAGVRGRVGGRMVRHGPARRGRRLLDVVLVGPLLRTGLDLGCDRSPPGRPGAADVDRDGRCRARRRCASAAESSPATSIIPSCWRRRWRRSTCCRKDGSRSASAPDGCATSTTGLGCRWPRPACGSPSSPSTSTCCAPSGRASRWRSTASSSTSRGFAGLPVPVQQPGPPIMIGGGAPKILGLAGRLADIVSINFDNSSGRLGSASVMSSGADETAQQDRLDPRRRRRSVR